MARKISLFIVGIILTAFQLSAQITCRFTTSDTSGCTSSSSFFVFFIDSSTGGTRVDYTYKWVVRNAVSGVLTTVGFSPTLNTYSYAFSSAGTYSVTEYVAEGTDTATFTQRIFVSVPPVVNFTTTPTALASYTLCPPMTVNFINTSADTSACTNNVWLWSIDDPSRGFHVSLSGSSPSYTFRQQGTYNVELTLTSCCGSQSITKTALVNIAATPAGGFSTSATGSACHLPATINFINTSTGASAYLWKFANGGTSTLTNPSHVYTDNAIYTDTLIVYNSTGCTDTVIRYGDVHVGVLNSGFTATSPVCLGSMLTCQDTTSGWVGNKWMLTPIPPATYSNASANSTEVSFSIPATGRYIVYDSTVGTSSCWNVKRDTITVVGLPTVSVSGTNLYRCSEPDTVNFTATVNDAVSIENWLWNFGDLPSGVADTSSSPSTAQHIYRGISGSSYTDTLKVTDINGCSGSAILSNFVSIQAPHASIATSVDSGCLPLTFTYTLTTVTPHKTYIIDSVTYGDGTAPCLGEGCLPGSHIYNDTGHFKVRMYYHMPDSLGGCSFSDSTNTIHVGNFLPNFLITMSADSVCPNTLVQFNDGCTNCTSRTWTNILGAGRLNGINDSSYAEFTHLITPGLDSVKWVGNVNGCFVRVDTFIWVFRPAAGFTISPPDCSDIRKITFNGSGSTGATGFNWNFGDGSGHVSGDPVTHTYTSYGVYSVIMTDTGNAANHYCRNTDTVVLNLHPTVDTFHIKDLYPCINTIDSFTASRIPPDSALYKSYIWKFGDGATTTITSTYKAGHSYANSGVYLDTLIIGNRIGGSSGVKTCYDTIPAASPVYVGPQMRLINDSIVCADAAALVTDSSVVFSNTTITTRQWSIATLGTSFASKGMDTSFTLPEGRFSICLVDSDNHHCWNQACVNVTAVRPHAWFYSPDSGLHVCRGIAIPFVDTNSSCSYLWQFGDGTTSTAGQSVSHVFANDGTYSNTVIITTLGGGQYPAGCRDTFVYNNEFTLNNINASFTISPSVHSVTCPPLNGNTFNATTPFNDYTYWWKSTSTASSGYPAEWFDATDQFSMSYSDSLPGVYTITLLDSNSIGCKDSVSDTFYVGGPSGYVSLSTNDTGCLPFQTALTFHDTGVTAIDQFVWLINGALSSDILAVSDTLTFNTAGVYDSFHLVLTSGTGDSACTVHYLLPITMHIYTSPTITVTYPQHLCSKMEDTISVSGANYYYWSPATGLSATTGSQVVVFIDSSTSYQLTSFYNGCVFTQNVTVTLDSTVPATVIYPQHICTKMDITISASGADDYYWSPATGLSATTGSQVVVAIDSNVTYQLTSTYNGCVQTQEVTLTLDSLPQVPVIATTSDKMLCAGTNYQNFGAALPPATNTAYTWSALNAQMFEAGPSGQYALVNFDSAGLASVILAANYIGSNCKIYDTVTVTVGGGQVPSGKVIQASKQFIYLYNVVDFYQWGYDNTELDSAALPDATYQNYYLAAPDFTNKHYWVMAADNGCIQKTYFTPGVDSSLHRNEANTYIDTYPNPSSGVVNITVHSPNTGTARVDIEDINGRLLKSINTDNLQTQIDVADMQQGVYLINCYQDGVKIASTHVIKE